MTRRKKSHQSSHGSANRPRFWGRHAVAAALDNPDRRVLKAWATQEAATFMNFPPEVILTRAEVTVAKPEALCDADTAGCTVIFERA